MTVNSWMLNYFGFKETKTLDTEKPYRVMYTKLEMLSSKLPNAED